MGILLQTARLLEVDRNRTIDVTPEVMERGVPALPEMTPVVPPSAGPAPESTTLESAGTASALTVAPTVPASG